MSPRRRGYISPTLCNNDVEWLISKGLTKGTEYLGLDGWKNRAVHTTGETYTKTKSISTTHWPADSNQW